MKLINFLSFLFFAVSAIAQDDMSTDITYISGSDNNIELEVAVQAREKKSLEALACKSIINAYLFHGIEGVGTGQPILDELTRDRHATYLRSIFATRYTVFTSTPKKQFGPKKNIAGVFDATYRVIFRKTALDKDLCSYDIIDCGKKSVSLPTIMVVPYRQQGETYRYVLDHNPYIRVAIGKVQEGFRDAGYTTMDFIGRFEEAERHNNFMAENADSYAAQLIRNSGADIYVTVDCSIEQRYNNNNVALSLKAYYCATSNITAASTSNFHGNMPIDRCCVGAVHKILPDFLRQIKWPPTKINARLSVGIDGESSLRMYSNPERSDESIVLLVRNWVKDNVKEYHQQGISPTEIIFDSLTLPVDTDLTEFALKLAGYLDPKGLSTNYVIDGMSIYITLSESE